MNVADSPGTLVTVDSRGRTNLSPVCKTVRGKRYTVRRFADGTIEMRPTALSENSPS